jgi:hypothetical protein
MIPGLRLVSVILVALILVPEGSHLFSLINKMRLDKVSYLAAQRAYDGWALFGIVIAAALLSTPRGNIRMQQAAVSPFSLFSC